MADDAVPPSDVDFYVFLGIAVALLVVCGLTAGLTLGIMSVEPTHLAVLGTTGSPSQQAM
jgi:hypothetical protein